MRSVITILLFLTCSDSFGQLKDTRRAEINTSNKIPSAAILDADKVVLDTTHFGGGGSQTPWLTNINGNGKNLTMNGGKFISGTGNKLYFGSAAATHYDETNDALCIGCTETFGNKLLVNELSSTYLRGNAGSFSVGAAGEDRFSVTGNVNSDFSGTFGGANAGGAKMVNSSDATSVVIAANTGGTFNINSTGTAIGSASVPNSTVQFFGSVSYPYVAKTANYTATASDYTIHCTANSFTVTLPTATGITGRCYVIKNSGAGTITVAGTGGQTVEVGSVSPGIIVTYQATGSSWVIITQNSPPS